MTADLWPSAYAQMQAATTLKHTSGRQNRPNYEFCGPCPVCGGEDRFVVQPNQKRWLCRNCRIQNGKIQWGDALDYLALTTGVSREQAWREFVAEDRPMPPPQARRKPARTVQDAPGWRFRPIPMPAYQKWQKTHSGEILEAWARYKPVSAEMVEAYGLAVGRVPYSRCDCPRLIVPITDGVAVQCVRGRVQPGMSCPHTRDGKKAATWLANAGFSLQSLPLFNAQRCAPGCIAVVVENPVDAMILSEGPALAYEWLRQGVPQDILAAPLRRAALLAERGIRPIVGVATLSAYYWREAWEKVLAGCSLVVVALDNDLVGNGGGVRRPMLVKEWMVDHETAPADPCGPARQQALRAAGIPAVLYVWPGGEDYKDFGEWHNAAQKFANP